LANAAAATPYKHLLSSFLSLLCSIAISTTTTTTTTTEGGGGTIAVVQLVLPPFVKFF